MKKKSTKPRWKNRKIEKKKHKKHNIRSTQTNNDEKTEKAIGKKEKQREKPDEIPNKDQIE